MCHKFVTEKKISFLNKKATVILLYKWNSFIINLPYIIEILTVAPIYYLINDLNPLWAPC